MKNLSRLAAILTLASVASAFAQTAPDPDSFEAAGFTADNLYATGFALKEMNPVTPAHSDMAARTLRATATLANANAYALLAEMYLGGRIPPESAQTAVEEAIKYMNLAWDKGAANGDFDLGLLYYNVAIPGVSEETAREATVNFVPRDYDKAFRYFVAACDKGSGKACRWAGICYEQGTGTTKDFEKAAKTYQCAGRDGTARYLLANMLVSGRGIAQDVPTALTYCQAEIDRKGLDTGVSAYAAGQVYEMGIGVKVDKDKALAYYLIAVADGNADAKPAVDSYATGLYKNGYAFLRAGKYEAGLPMLVKSAHLGNAGASNLLESTKIAYRTRGNVNG